MKTSTRQLFKMSLFTLAGTFIVLLLGLVSPAKADAQTTTSTNPCPQFSIQNVFDDPNSDWDRDRVPNMVELNNGMRPCQADSDQFCRDLPSLCITYTVAFSCTATTPWTWTAVNAAPHSDWDRDGITNIVEARNGANPCVHPCPYPSQIDLILNPNGDWDLDGASNAYEVNIGQDPCRSTVYTVYQPCPNWTTADIAAQPHADWDRDGVTNRDEYYYGTNPCKAPVVVVQPTVPVYRYPVVIPSTVVPTYRSVPYVVQPPAGYRCTAKYPYYNPTTRNCNTRPVVTRFR